MDQTRFQFLLKKYLNEKCSLRELDELFLYIEKSPDDKLLQKIIDEEAENQKFTDDQIQPEISKAMRLSLQYKINREKRIPSRRRFITSHWKYAAVILFLMISGSALYFKLSSPDLIEIKTLYGEIREITLPDKSTVVLNSNSTLSYERNWSSEKAREVTLKGEAFFNVVHQEDHQKFWVHTNKVRIEVLGTEFNVNDRWYRTRVVLHSGQIRLDLENANLDKQNILMNSGDFIEVNQNETAVIHKTVDTDDYIAWKNKKLIFKNTPLQEILYLLNDDYGIKAVINDSSILNQTFTASYPADNIEILLTALSKSFRIRIENLPDEKSGKNIIVGY